MNILRPIQKTLSGVLILVFIMALSTSAQEKPEEALLKQFTFRNLGPFRAGSWVTSFAVPSNPPRAHL
jgi:hypothetical protein